MPLHYWRKYFTYDAEYTPFEYEYKEEDCIPNDTIIDVSCIVKDVEEKTPTSINGV